MDKKEIILELKDSYKMVLEMIAAAERSHMSDTQAYYTLRDGLSALIDSMTMKGFVEQSLYENWDKKVMWWVSRVLEGDPLLDKILAIDKEISTPRLC